MLFDVRRLLGACSAALLLSCPLFSQTAPPKNYGPFTGFFRLATGDSNRDGAADFIENANFNNGAQIEVVVHMNSGSGAFAPPPRCVGKHGSRSGRRRRLQSGRQSCHCVHQRAVGVAYGNGKGRFSSPLFC